MPGKLIEDKPIFITIDNFNGFCPAWFDNSYSYYGNKNQATDMRNIDITDLNVLTQSPGFNELLGATVTTLIKSIMSNVVSNDLTYAIGGAKLYQISSTAVADTGGWPHTIDKDAVTGENGEDVVFFQSNIYYFYNHSGNAGDIGKYTIATSTFDDDWGSTVPTGKETLQNAPHQAILGGDDNCYFTNGRYIGRINNNGSLDAKALDFWTNAEVSSIVWSSDRIIAAVNRPNIPGSNFNESGIYRWDTVSPSWDGNPIEVSGRIGALYVKNGIPFIWWQDSTDAGGYNFGYVGGNQIVPLRRFKGSLPLFYQVGEYKGFIMWVAGGLVYLWGAKEPDLPTALFQYTEGGYPTVGGIAAPFGTLFIASTNGTGEYSLAKLVTFSYLTNCYWKSMVFKASGPWTKLQLLTIIVETEPLLSGARADFTLTYDKGKYTQTLDPIIASVANTTRHKILNKSLEVEDFRLDISFANGSVIRPVKIRSIMIAANPVKYN